jgi:hypothetical protein
MQKIIWHMALFLTCLGLTSGLGYQQGGSHCVRESEVALLQEQTQEIYDRTAALWQRCTPETTGAEQNSTPLFISAEVVSRVQGSLPAGGYHDISSLLDITPASVYGKEQRFPVAAICEALQKARGEKTWPQFVRDFREVLWSLAWLYGAKGIRHARAGEEEEAINSLAAACTLYDSLFLPSQRGDLRRFGLVGILQMSRVYFACGRYEEMLAYIYTIRNDSPFAEASTLLRPALQFLLAEQTLRGASQPAVGPVFSK